MSVRTIDRGWNKIKKELSAMERKYVQIGVQESETREDGVSATLIAAFNEFGTKRSPERSFLRSSFDENVNNYSRLIRVEKDKILTGTSTVERSLGLIGQFAEANIKRKITALKEPANAPSTIEQKGSSNPLIDTGTLRNSIKYVIKES